MWQLDKTNKRKINKQKINQPKKKQTNKQSKNKQRNFVVTFLSRTSGSMSQKHVITSDSSGNHRTFGNPLACIVFVIFPFVQTCLSCEKRCYVHCTSLSGKFWGKPERPVKDKGGNPTPGNRLVGPLVKECASRAEESGFECRFATGFFRGRIISVT